MKRLAAYLASEQGVTAAEYGILVGAIALGVVTVVFFLGTSINDVFMAADNSLVDRIIKSP